MQTLRSNKGSFYGRVTGRGPRDTAKNAKPYNAMDTTDMTILWSPAPGNQQERSHQIQVPTMQRMTPSMVSKLRPQKEGHKQYHGSQKRAHGKPYFPVVNVTPGVSEVSANKHSDSTPTEEAQEPGGVQINEEEEPQRASKRMEALGDGNLVAVPRLRIRGGNTPAVIGRKRKATEGQAMPDITEEAVEPSQGVQEIQEGDEGSGVASKSDSHQSSSTSATETSSSATSSQAEGMETRSSAKQALGLTQGQPKRSNSGITYNVQKSYGTMSALLSDKASRDFNIIAIQEPWLSKTKEPWVTHNPSKDRFQVRQATTRRRANRSSNNSQQPATGTCIDLVWATQEIQDRIYTYKVEKRLDHASDHLPVATMIDIEPRAPPATLKKAFTKLDPELLKRAVKENLPEVQDICTTAEVDLAVAKIIETLNKGIEESVPKVKITRFSRPGFDDNAKDAIRELKKANRRKQLNPTADNFKAFQEAKDKRDKAISKCNRQIHQKLVSEEGWHYGTMAEDLEGKCEAFRETLFPKPPEWPKITEWEVTEALRYVPPDKAPGEDDIPNRVLKTVAEELAPTLTELFNASLRLGYCLEHFRKSVTVILRKPGKPDYSSPKAYRPIALMNTLVEENGAQFRAVTKGGYIDDVGILAEGKDTTETVALLATIAQDCEEVYLESYNGRDPEAVQRSSTAYKEKEDATALNALQKRALCVATGVFRTTALVALEKETYTMGIEPHLLRLSTISVARLMMSPAYKALVATGIVRKAGVHPLSKKLSPLQRLEVKLKEKLDSEIGQVEPLTHHVVPPWW
ncbi:hypothetical protein B7463_g3176, partial [Scytalidium lignicola]